MSHIVLALTLCSFSSCNTYIIETDSDGLKPKACQVLMDQHHQKLDSVWHFDYSGKTLFKDYAKLEEYLSTYSVQEDSLTLDSYELECLDL